MSSLYGLHQCSIGEKLFRIATPILGFHKWNYGGLEIGLSHSRLKGGGGGHIDNFDGGS